MSCDGLSGMFKDKSFLITGGTGSFGRSMVEKLIAMEVGKVVVFSRDETKQSQMRTSTSSSMRRR